jgi:glutathione S-transferase
MLKLYGAPPTRALRAIWLLNELDLEYEIHPVDLLQGEQRRPEFRELNPASKVPVLVDGDVVLNESVAIQLYLAEKRPEARLIPDTPKQRAEMYRWIFFMVTEIEQPLWRIARHTFVYPEEMRIPRDVEIATRECTEMLRVVERHMQHREFFVDDRPSVADFNAAYLLDWAREAGLLGESPRLRSWVETMYARPKAPVTIAESLAASAPTS